jgi:uncharacterized FlaG/YvyC family protein
MDPKGIDLLNLTPVLITQAIKTDRRLPQVIKPVEQSARSELRSTMEKAEKEALLLNPRIDERLRKRLKAFVRLLEQRAAKKWKKKVGLRWKWQADQNLLIVEFIDEATGELLEEVPLNELLKGLNQSELALHGLLINKTA